MTDKQMRLLNSIRANFKKESVRLEELLKEIQERDDEATGDVPSLDYDYSLANSLESAQRSINEGIGELSECVEEYADR